MPPGSRCLRVRLAHIAVGHAEFRAVQIALRFAFYDNAGHVIEAHGHAGVFKDWYG